MPAINKRTFSGVEFSDFTWKGGPSCTLSFRLPRTKKEHNADVCEQLLCGFRVKAEFSYEEEVGSKQKRLINPTVACAAEVKNFRTDPDNYSSSLNIKLCDLPKGKNEADVADFKKKTGKLAIEKIGAIEVEDDDDDEETDDGDVPGQTTFED